MHTIGVLFAVGVVVQETNQCAGIKIQIPGLKIISIYFKSPTNGVSFIVRFAGKQPFQFAGRDV